MGNLADTLSESYNSVISGIVTYLPNIIIAVLIVIFGWLLGAVLSKFISEIIKGAKLDKALSAAGLRELLHKGGFDLNSGKFLGELVKWFTIVVFLVTALEVLDLNDITEYLSGVIGGYIPQVIGAVIMIFISILIADALGKVVYASAKSADLKYASFLSSITKWSIWIFAGLAALFQLRISPVFIQTFFTGVIAALSIGLGLAFGLGGRDAAARAIEKLGHDMSEKNHEIK